ncbi:MAG: Ig domain-containing protein, partial [Lachnospiraceae bacterium]|nr:Ig domain-containing protein [Lachnospiraceae bacterium]
YLTDGTIKQCRNSGMVNDSYTYNKGPFSGGVVGIIDGGTVENCFNTGIVKGGDDVGGVAGVVICNTSSQNKGNVINCYNCTGQLDAEDDTYRGGVIGRIIDSIAVNSFYDKSLLTNSRAVGYEQGVNTFNNVEGKTTTEMTGLNASAYTGWDYENIWRLTTGYPELRLFSKNYFNLVDDNIGLGLNGEITYTDPELSAGSIIKVPYNVTLNGGSAVNRISYIIAEGSYTVDDVKIKGYGKVENCDSAGSGNVYIFIPAIFDKTKDRIYLVAEHVNAEQETDHLSKPLAVYPAPGPEPTPTPTEIDVVSVALDNSLVKLECGQTYALKATVNPSDATDKTLTWKSGNKKVATVSADGRVTGVGKGTTTITATSSNGKTASCKVRVKEYKDIKRVYITPSSVHLKVGKTRTVRAIILPKKAKNKRVIWKSSNTKVATVTPVSINKAKITAVERGTAKITVTTADSKKKRSIKVIVRKK